MSVFRVITRIIPLNSSGSTFEPASFDQLTDGNVGEVKVLNLTEPQTGMKYRIERIEYMQNTGPGETIESINKAYAEKLKNIPGFVELKSGDTPLNPYDKSFQLTLPKVLLGKNSNDDSQQNKSSESFKISVVKNFKFKKASPKKKVSSSVTLSKSGKEEMKDKLKSPPKSLNDSKAPFKSKYPSYLSKKIKNSVWKKKIKSPPKLKSPKHSKSKKLMNGFSLECTANGEMNQNLSCPTSNYMKADQDLDVRNILDRILDENLSEEKLIENHDEPSAKKRKVNITDDEETDFSDNSLGSNSGALVINVIDEADVSGSSKDENSQLLNSNAQDRHNSSTSEDSLLTDSFDATNQTESSGTEVFQESKDKNSDDTICKKYIISEGHPAHDLLVALKKYFLNGECLICGFIPADKDFNACDHMESHVLCNSFASSYKCSCCDDKFSDPRNLYMHALSREKIYNYVCSICTLKFKRRHYLLRHTSKSH